MQKKLYPTCALIISTYNWPQALELCLLSVLKQKILPNEIIIADDGSTIETKNLIDKCRQQFKIPLIHVWHEDIGFRKTIVLNEAIRNSSSAYIIQIDGDIILHRLFIKEHMQNAKKGFFIRGSRTLINDYKTKYLIDRKQYSINFYSSGLLNRLNAFHNSGFSKLMMLFSKNNSPKDVIGCNTSFWKNDFIKINGYNNDMVGWGREDGELAARLINSNVKKKKLKFNAICFHLYHKLYLKGKNLWNEDIYNKAIYNKTSICVNGYSTKHDTIIWC